MVAGCQFAAVVFPGLSQVLASSHPGDDVRAAGHGIGMDRRHEGMPRCHREVEWLGLKMDQLSIFGCFGWVNIDQLS